MRTPEGIEKDRLRGTKNKRGYLDEIGAAHRWPVPRGYGKADIDCHASIFGTFWAIEVKAEGEEPTPQQYRTLKEFALADAQVVWGTADVIIAAIQTWLQNRVGTREVGKVQSNVHAPLS